MPAYSEMLLRDMTTRTLQTHFSGLGNSTISGDVVLKIKEVLSSVLKSAVEYEMLIGNPMLAVQIPRLKVVNKRKPKPYLTPEEFDRLLSVADEPYASMIYVAVHSGLRGKRVDRSPVGRHPLGLAHHRRTLLSRRLERHQDTR